MSLVVVVIVLPTNVLDVSSLHSLHKEKEHRPKYDKLLKLKFITDNEDSDIAQFVISVLDSAELSKKMSEMDVKK